MSSDPWKVVIAPSPALPQVFDTNGHLLASLHRPRAQAANDAILFAHAPAMLDALQHAAEVFAAMASHDPGPSGQIAAHTYEQLDKFLRGPLSVWSDGGSS
jgi:hypothetical protein